jgi:molybdenum cofactor synthesis domain-containing protein
MYTVGVIVASDKGSRGERDDLSGKLISTMMEEKGYSVQRYVMLPDEEDILYNEMIYMSDQLNINLILSTGGTGFSKRDVTPEATLKAITKHAPGIAEAIRYNSLQITPKAMLSRGVAGIRGNTLIINLPGSPKAVKESLSFILEPLYHGLQILLGDTSECGEVKEKRQQHGIF